jgi:hypothetical protein
VAYFSGNEGTPAEARVWDSVTGVVYTPPNAPDTDLFCCGIALTFDGRMFVAGGTALYSEGPGFPWIGSKAAYLFDSTQGWQRLEDMSFGRWYPSIICLPDGRMLVASGEGEDGARTQQIEIFDLQNGWQVLPPSANRYLPLYPRLHVLPDGRISCTGLGGTTAILDVEQATWTELGAPGGFLGIAPAPGVSSEPNIPPGFEEGGYQFTGGDAADKNNWVNLRTGKTEAQEESDAASRRGPIRFAGLARHNPHDTGGHHVPHGSATRADDLCVLLDPTMGWRVLHTGGLVEEAGTTAAELIDFSDPNPTWRAIAPMNHGRWFPNSALLPNGKLLVVGGGRVYNADPIFEAEIFDPDTETWSEEPPMTVPRLYHSVALLLPDGRVWVAGTDAELRMELYSPDYLDAGPRPVIGPAPQAVAYGQFFAVQVDDAQDIGSVCFIRLGTATHAFNTEQRCVSLEFTASAADQLEITAPTNLNLAPPGHYMLFIMNTAGVPAVAPIVQLLAV